MAKKIKVALLSGGPSSEHEVSLKSSENVLKHLDLAKFEILHIKISKEGAWVEQATGLRLSEAAAIQYLKKSQVDLVFIMLHGEYGEDGTIQGLLETEGIKFTGSNSKASSVAMDKIMSSGVLAKSSLKIPVYIEIKAKEWVKESDKIITSLEKNFSYPLVVKPADRGSSVGVSIVERKELLSEAFNNAFKFSKNVMVQEYIKGRELTCAVIEGKKGELIPLIPTEILPSSDHDFFDYAAKYESGASVEITPPDLPKKMIDIVRNTAVRVHKIIGCSHISRVDFILKNDELYVLEINTIPGMTETSLVPQGAKAYGIEFPLLLEILIEAAIR